MTFGNAPIHLVEGFTQNLTAFGQCEIGRDMMLLEEADFTWHNHYDWTSVTNVSTKMLFKGFVSLLLPLVNGFWLTFTLK